MAKIKKTPLAALLKGIVISYIITMLVFIIYAILLTYTNISPDYISITALVTTAASCIICGFVTAKASGSKGLLWGIVSGGCYMIIMFTLGFATIPTFALNQKLVVSLCLALGGGAVGGVFGVNR